MFDPSISSRKESYRIRRGGNATCENSEFDESGCKPVISKKQKGILIVFVYSMFKNVPPLLSNNASRK